MNAAILAIGDELISGQTIDTNTRWIAGQLERRGITVTTFRTIGDDQTAIALAYVDLAHENDVLISTGGLGPTKDDLTRFALAHALAPEEELVVDERALKTLERRYERRLIPMPESNHVQALRPRKSECLSNPRGTAPGIKATIDGCDIYCLPGPPGEMEAMFERHITPALPGGDVVTAAATVHAYGLSEADGGERLGALMARGTDPLIGLTTSGSLLTARIRSKGRQPESKSRVQLAAEHVVRAWEPYAFGRDSQSLPEVVGRLLSEQGETVATAESCTGGLLGSMLVDIPGSSAWYCGGWITYCNGLKHSCLNVSDESLKRAGAVSATVATEMARGVLCHADTEHALTITGLAGPAGGSAEKPVGTVFVAYARSDDPVRVIVRRFCFTGTRNEIRDRSAKAALQILRFSLLGVDASTRLLWQVNDTAHVESTIV